ncbi:hypothetical protein [Kitasatospora griseola]|uniref:hypothetical protein n=1 Tax=Kitasatospora griseola TaxID=2064 RepID=UPI0036533CFA
MIRAAKPAAALAALALTVLTASAVPAAGVTAPLPAAAATADPLAALRGQQPRWHPCTTSPEDTAGAELDAAGAGCTELAVPLDYRRPDGPTTGVALARLPATDQARRLGTLFYNPGGPGVPARDLALTLRRAAPGLAARYDIVGMGPRFVGASTPSTAAGPRPAPARPAPTG